MICSHLIYSKTHFSPKSSSTFFFAGVLWLFPSLLPSPTLTSALLILRSHFSKASPLPDYCSGLLPCQSSSWGLHKSGKANAGDGEQLAPLVWMSCAQRAVVLLGCLFSEGFCSNYSPNRFMWKTLALVGRCVWLTESLAPFAIREFPPELILCLFWVQEENANFSWRNQGHDIKMTCLWCV